MLDLVFERVEPDAILPTRGSVSAAGFDMYIQDDTIVGPGVHCYLGTGVRVELFDDEWANLKPRSSTLRTTGLLVIEGVIDSDYKGEIKIAVLNVRDEPVTVYKGTRIAQLVLMQNLNFSRVPVWGSVDRDSIRGTGGFGSTGR